jgi:hypothetical protein
MIRLEGKRVAEGDGKRMQKRMGRGWEGDGKGMGRGCRRGWEEDGKGMQKRNRSGLSQEPRKEKAQETRSY